MCYKKELTHTQVQVQLNALTQLMISAYQLQVDSLVSTCTPVEHVLDVSAPVALVNYLVSVY